MKTFRPANLALVVVIILGVIFMGQVFFNNSNDSQEITATEFIQLWQNRDIAKLEIIGESSVSGETRAGEKFFLVYPGTSELLDELRTNPDLAASVALNIKKENNEFSWGALLPSIISTLIVVVIFIIFMNQIQGGNNKTMQFAKSKAKLYSGEKGKTTFEDVAGVDEAIEELGEIVDFLKQPKRYADMGAKMPRGILLVGAPGTGKTLLAKAVAGEAGVPFFTTSGSDFVEMFVGVGASRVRDMFEQAKRCLPCIVFIDEIDAVGRQRGTGLGGGHDEREQTLNQILVEMDGFDPNMGLIVIAATNRPDVLDPALLRPGRFDRRVTVDYPDVKGREEILKVHAKGKPLDEAVNLSEIAKGTVGFTGADLANLLNEATLLAVRQGKKKVEQDDIQEAVERTYAGPSRKSRVLSDQEKNLVAFHEAGHALVGCLTPTSDPVLKVTIIPRGRAGGYTLMIPEDDRKHKYATKNEMVNEIEVLLGGRVAEELALKEVSTGASNDLERATKIARKMVAEYGMSDLGPVTFGSRSEEMVFLGRDFNRDKNYSEKVAAQIDEEINKIVHEAYDKVKKLLNDNLDKLTKIAEMLKEKEVVSGDQIRELIAS